MLTFVRTLLRPAVFALALSAPAVAAHAQIVTVNFTGAVTSLPDPTGLFAGAAVGDTFTGSLVYDTTAAPVTPGANPAQYLYTGASTPAFASPLGITVTLNGITLTPRYPGVMIVTVANDLVSNPTYPDVLIAQAAMTSPGPSVGNPVAVFGVADQNGTALSSTSLPSGLNLSSFTDGVFQLDNNTAGNVFNIFVGSINVSPAAVPEPSAFALLSGIAVPGMMLCRRRRAQR